MKTYLITTGTVFGLITLAHLVRIVSQWPHPGREPVFVLLTIAAGAMSYWAWHLLRRLPRS